MGFNNNFKAPCFGCENRNVGCHGSCNEYAAYKIKCETRNKNRIRDNEHDRDVVRCRGFNRKYI